MSLMNDALRKKNRQRFTRVEATDRVDSAPRRLSLRTWIGLIGSVVVCTSAIGGVYLTRSESGSSLQVRPLAVAAPPPAVNQILDPVPPQAMELTSTDGQEPSDDGQTTADVSTTVTRANKNESVAPLSEARPRLAHVGSNPPNRSLVTTSPLSTTASPPPVSLPSPAEEEPPTAIRTVSVDNSYEPVSKPPIQAEQHQKRAPGDAPPPGYGQPMDQAATSKVTIAEPTADNTVRTDTQSTPTVNLFYDKAIAYHRRGQLTDAIRFYRQVLKSDFDHQGALMNLAAAYIEQEKYSDATPLLNRLEKSKTRPKGVLLNLAIAAIGIGNPQKALVYLDNAEAVSDALPWEIRFHRAVAYAQMNRLEKAMILYDEVAKERPNDSRLRFNLAVTCDALGRYTEALAHYERYLDLASFAPAANSDSINQRIRTLRKYVGGLLPQADDPSAVADSSTVKG